MEKQSEKDSTQKWMDQIVEEKGQLWGIIVHELTSLRAMLHEFAEKGVDPVVTERLVLFGAGFTGALVDHGNYTGREGEIMADSNKMMELAMAEVKERLSGEKA